MFSDQEEAARAYDKEAVKHDNPFNFPPDGPSPTSTPVAGSSPVLAGGAESGEGEQPTAALVPAGNDEATPVPVPVPAPVPGTLAAIEEGRPEVSVTFHVVTVGLGGSLRSCYPSCPRSIFIRVFPQPTWSNGNAECSICV
jgi:hypothetical protein